MADKAEFYSQLYWDTQDGLRTTNNFKVSFLLVKDQYGIQVGRIQLTIQNYKNRERSSINFTFRELYLYLVKVKAKNGPIEIKINGGKKFTTTQTKTMEYDQSVLLSISARGEDILDSEKFYMSIQEYYAFVKLLSYIMENYPLITSTICNYILLQGIGFEISQGNQVLGEIKRQQIQGMNVSVMNSSLPTKDAVIEVPVEETKDQEDLGTYIEANMEDIDLGLSKDEVDKKEEKKKVNE